MKTNLRITLFALITILSFFTSQVFARPILIPTGGHDAAGNPCWEVWRDVTQDDINNGATTEEIDGVAMIFAGITCAQCPPIIKKNGISVVPNISPNSAIGIMLLKYYKRADLKNVKVVKDHKRKIN